MIFTPFFTPYAADATLRCHDMLRLRAISRHYYIFQQSCRYMLLFSPLRRFAIDICRAAPSCRHYADDVAAAPFFRVYAMLLMLILLPYTLSPPPLR